MESRIHFQPIVPRETGATHGRRIRNLTRPRPRNGSSRAVARMFEHTITMTWADSVNTMEFRIALRKPGLCRMLRKFSRPTKWKPEPPIRASLNA